MSSPTTLSGGGSALFPRGWTDQLWHDMNAQGRAKLALVPEGMLPRKTLTDDHKRKLREGLQAYHERRRAGLEG